MEGQDRRKKGALGAGGSRESGDRLGLMDCGISLIIVADGDKEMDHFFFHLYNIGVCRFLSIC